MLSIAMGILGLLRRGKNYALQFVLGHRLVPARPSGMVATSICTNADFEDRLDELLLEHVDRNGRVDYDSLVRPERKQLLSNLVQFIASHSPVAQPAEYDTEAKQLAYYMNAYNALVLWGVVCNWPLASVRAAQVWAVVKLAPIQPFFISLHFEVAGFARVGRGGLNLFDLEHKIIRPFGDARIHAAINCASGGCPRLRETAFRAATLDGQLDECMVEMVTDPRHLRVDDARHSMTVSMIFKWYQGDFVGPKQAPSLWAYWMRFLTPQDHQLLFMACQSQYSIEYDEYDWNINSQAAARRTAATAAARNAKGHRRQEDGSLPDSR